MMCAGVNQNDFITLHHEMGHVYRAAATINNYESQRYTNSKGNEI